MSSPAQASLPGRTFSRPVALWPALMSAPTSPWGLGPSTAVAAGVLTVVMAVLSSGWSARRPSPPTSAVTWLQPPPRTPSQTLVPPAAPKPEPVEAPAPEPAARPPQRAAAPKPLQRPRQENRSPAPRSAVSPAQSSRAANAVDAVTPPPDSTAAADAAEPVERAEAAATQPAVRSWEAPASTAADVHVVCPVQVRPRFPELADEEAPPGSVVRARALVQDGRVRSVEIVSGPRILHRAVREAMLQYRCRTEPGETVEVLQDFRLAY